MVSAWGCLGHTAFAVWSKGSAEATCYWRWQLLFLPPRTEPAAGKETGAAKVSKNLELARLIPASSSAREQGPVGLQGGPGGPGDPAPGIEIRAPLPLPLSTGAPRPSWLVSAACPSSAPAPASPRLWMRWVVGAPGYPPALLPLLPLPQPKLTPQEKLKLRMQKALNRQCTSWPRPSRASLLLFHVQLGKALLSPDRRPLGRSRCAPALWPPGPGPL